MKCKDADLLNKTSTSLGNLLSFGDWNFSLRTIAFPSRLGSELIFQNYR